MALNAYGESNKIGTEQWSRDLQWACTYSSAKDEMNERGEGLEKKQTSPSPGS